MATTVLWASLPLAAEASSSNQQRAERHLAAALADGLDPADLHHLTFIFNWRHTLPRWQWLHVALDRLSAGAGTDALMADELRLRRATVAVDEGRFAAAQEYFRAMGGLQQWWAHGPVDLEELEDFTTQAMLPAGDPAWRPVPGTDPLGWVTLSGLAWPARRQLIYLATTIHSDNEQAVAVRLGAAQVARVWLDGAEVLTTTYPLERAEDQVCGGAWLRAGNNRLVVAVAAEEDSWWVRVRLTAPDGSPLRNAREVSTDGPPQAVAPEQRPAPAIRCLQTEIENAVAEGQPGALTALAAFHVVRHPEPVTSGTARTACRRARAESPAEARLLEWLVTSEQGAARELLEQALAADPDLLMARIPLAAWYHGRGLRQQATRLLTEAGDDLLAHTAQLDIDATIWGPLVLPELAELAASNPDSVEVRTVLAQRAIELDHWHLARQSLAGLERLVPGNARLRVLRERLAADCGDGEAVQELLAELVANDPNLADSRVRLARLQAAAGQTGAARHNLQEGLRRCPNHADLLSELARLEHAEGNDREAVRLARTLLTERPQDRQARRLLDQLDEEGEDRSWLRSPEQLWRLAGEADTTGPAVMVLKHHELHFLPGRLTEERVQTAVLINIAEQADAWRQQTLAHVPERQSLRVLAARILRPDGSEVAATKSDTPRLTEPELNMYYDTRLRVLQLNELEDGDLIEVSYILSETAEANETGPYQGGLINLGSDIPILNAEIELHGNEELMPAWELANIDGVPTRTESPDGTVSLGLVWQHLPAVAREVPSAPPLLVTPHLAYSSHADWGDLADWYARHVAPRVRVSQQVEELATTLTEGILQRRHKIDRLYRYVTDNIRYVGLELGEHRFRPFSADWVLNHKIGDCKDKAALLVTLLRVVGIPARMALLRTSDLGPVVIKKALLQDFNHVIVYLPEDDLWLDGTATGHAMDLPPAGDQQALALVIDGPDSRPRTTPVVGAGEARYRYELQRGEPGQVALTLRVEDTGNAASSRRAQLAGSNDPRRFTRWLQSLFPAADLTGEPLVRMAPGKDPTVIDLQATVPRASLLGAGGLRTYPGTLGLVQRLAPVAGRQTPVLLPVGPDAIWSIHVELGRRPNDLPEGAELQTPFGSLSLTIEDEGTAYQVNGHLHLTPGVIEAGQGAALREFLVAVERHLDRPLEVP